MARNRLRRIFRVLTNRVLIGMVAFFVLVGFWEFRWKPQYRPHYELGVSHYQAARYPEAVAEFQQAYAIAPNSLDVIMMLGWAHFKVNQFEEARFFFDRALRINPRTEEAQLGSAFVALETGRGTLDVDLIREYLGNRGGDPGVRTISAGALAKEGRWFEAAEIYRGLVNDRDYGSASRLALEDMFGLKGTTEPWPAAFQPLTRPPDLQAGFRAADRAFWRREGTEWRPFYVAGINFGAALPGYFPNRPPNDAAEYGTWIDRAAQLNATVLRVYNLLPPAFYRAFERHVAGGGRLTLFQQIWVGDPPNRDLFDTAFVEQTRTDIRLVIDALHGRGEVPPGPGRKGGVYDKSVAAAVGGLLFGREFEPSLVSQTNVLNAGERNYAGRYVQVSDATATEVWLARMMDYAVTYETQTYNRQHPIAVVNWPPLDPLFHLTEAPLLQELRFRVARGEQEIEFPSGPQDDADVVTVDESRLSATPEFVAGIFAAYHTYPHWPDFMLHETALAAARDEAGPNPLLGYLQQLVARVRHPLVVAEYGVPSSIGVSHLSPLGWSHGGMSEAEQAARLTRLAAAVHTSGAAGGMAFALHDEWYKHNWLVRAFEQPADRNPLWMNDVNPDQRFGVVGFRPSKHQLFAGDAAAWKGETTLYPGTPRKPAGADPFDGARTLGPLQIAADEAYLYLRLSVGCLDCAPRDRRPDGLPRFDKASYAIAINTLPGAAGIATLPFGGLTVPGGANFVLLLTDPPSSRLLIADNYTPYEIVATPGVAGETDWRPRASLTPALVPAGTFGELIVEPNVRRHARDGRLIPAQRTSRSLLQYGVDRAGSPQETSLGEWYADMAGNVLVIRIPWGKLLVTDPSSRSVFGGYQNRQLRVTKTDGIEVAAFALVPGDGPSNSGTWSVAASLPAGAGGTLGGVQRFVWSTWETVKPTPYVKPAYAALQTMFAAQTKGLVPSATPPTSRP